jgi:Carboxypeptidase regulatory-like domain/TonB-dependent Receptor Plug Domain
MVRIRVSILLLSIAALSAWPAAAQQTTGEIAGKVVDESGGVLPGVSVTLHGDVVVGAPMDVTTGDGSYRFPLLAPGTYDVEYSLSGFNTLVRKGIPVAVGGTVSLNVQMKIGTLNETVTVTGDAPVVNATQAEVATNYNHEYVRNTPVRRNSYFDYVNSAPGVSANSNIGQGSAAQSLGSSTNENQYQIDGTDISSTPWPNPDAVEEVQVVQLGASAQYGNVQGAVFNIVTRQGTNTPHGDANFYYQNDALTGRNTTEVVDKGFPYHRDTWQDATFQAAGPFVTDKFWYFGSFQYQRDYDSQPGVDPTFPAKNDARRVFWKFNYNITPNQRLMHGYHDDYYWIPDVPTAYTAPTTLSLSHGDNPTPNVVYTSVFSSKTILEVRYSGFWLKSSRDPNLAGESRVQTRYEDDDTGLITGGISSWSENRSWRNGTSAKLTHYYDAFLGGSHETNIGLQYGGHGSDSVTGPNDTITTYSLSGKPSTGTTQLPYHQGARARWAGAYIDDNYHLGRATMNLGVRYDYSQAIFPSFPFLDATGNPTGEMSTPNNDVYHWNTFSPRVGVNYQLTSSGSTIVKAHYGRYYKALEANEFRPAVPSVTPAYEFKLDAAGNRTDFVQVSSNANLLIDPNFKPAYTDQIMVQVEHELTHDLGLQVAYAYKRGENYGAWTDTAGQYELVPYVDSVGQDATGDTLMLYKLVSDPAGRVFLQTNPAGMYTRYHGMTLQVTKRMSHNWQGVFSLVLSRDKGRLGSSARANPTTNQSSQAGTFGRETAGPNDFVNTDGLLAGDRPVVAKAQIVYRLPGDIMLAGNLQHQTGRAYARQVRVSGLGFPTAPTIYMEEVDGSRRVADLNLIDLRVQKDLAIPGSTMKLGLFLDAMNLANSDTNEGVASVLGTSSAFGVPTKYIPPRRMQLGMKVQW